MYRAAGRSTLWPDADTSTAEKLAPRGFTGRPQPSGECVAGPNFGQPFSDYLALRGALMCHGFRPVVHRYQLSVRECQLQHVRVLPGGVMPPVLVKVTDETRTCRRRLKPPSRRPNSVRRAVAVPFSSFNDRVSRPVIAHRAAYYWLSRAKRCRVGWLGAKLGFAR